MLKYFTSIKVFDRESNGKHDQKPKTLFQYLKDIRIKGKTVLV